MTNQERQLLERLADEGKPSQLAEGELHVAKQLEREGLACVIPNTCNAVITPRGRHVLAGSSQAPKRNIKPFGFIE